MSEISREDALAHFGVKGMRWGVRNDTKTSTASKTKTDSSESKKSGVKKAAVKTAKVLGIVGGTAAATTVAGAYAALTVISNYGETVIKDIGPLPNPVADQINEVNSITTRANEITKELESDPMYSYGSRR